MKKTMLSLLAFLPMVMMAQTPRADYNQLNPCPTPEQVANPKVRAEKEAFYEKLDAEMEAQSEAAAERVGASAQAQQAQANRMLQQQNKATSRQKQAQQQMAGDMMQIIQNLGIPMEQLAQMSDEEIEALVMQKAMPQMAQNSGLTPAEMEKLSKMSDREAEAYMKAHPDVMARYQNSRYGQQANELRGMEQQQEISDADQELYNRIFEINHQTIELNSQWLLAGVPYGGNESELSSTDYYRNFFASYEERISDIISELQSRCEKEHSVSGEYPMPAYGKGYYNRANAVVDEANLAFAKEWCKSLDPRLNKYRKEVETLLPLYEEQQKLYDRISAPDVRLRADALMINGVVYSAIQAYIRVLRERLAAPFMDYEEMPDTISVCIDCEKG